MVRCTLVTIINRKCLLSYREIAVPQLASLVVTAESEKFGRQEPDGVLQSAAVDVPEFARLPEQFLQNEQGKYKPVSCYLLKLSTLHFIPVIYYYIVDICHRLPVNF